MLIALDLLMSACQGSLFVYLLKKQFIQRPHSVLYEIACILSVVLFFSTIQYLHLPISDAFVMLILFIYIRLTSQERFITCLFWTVVDGFLFVGTLTLVSALFDIQIGLNGDVLAASDATRIIYAFTGNAALAVVFNIAARFGKAENTISRKEAVLFVLLLLLCLGINECFFLARMSVQWETAMLIGPALSFVAMVLIMILYERLTETTRKQRQTELEAQTAQLVAEHQDELKSIYKHMLAEQHDLRHRIAAAEEILSSATLSNEQRCQAHALLNGPEQPDLFITGCLAVDAILKAKAAVMENTGITFEYVEYPLAPLPIPEQRFCLLLGNLLDNAIEGVMRLPAASSSRKVRLTFSKVWNMLFITCVNNADESKIKRCGNDFLSTKDHPELHGFGTKSMKKIVEDANGTIEFEIKQGKFTVQIMLGGTPPC